MIKILLIFAPLFISSFAFAYPDFISYGYKSCITCHFNGAGSGPLNDYGRALFATEITAADADVSEEQLSNESGFLGSTEIPWWIRPGFKFRGLFLKTRLEDGKNSSTRVIPMQLSFNTAFLLDQRADMMVMGSVDYMPTPTRFGNTNEKKPMSLVAKDYYFRWQMAKGYILYTGLMDKPYGIRHPDHTAFNRGVNSFGLNQNDQSHGVTLQYNKDKLEMFFNYFLGNFNQDSPLRQKGFTLTGEYAIEKDMTVGASALRSTSEYLDVERTSVHSRIGFAKGKSVMAEVGVRTDKPKQVTDPAPKFGAFTYVQTLIAYQRGYNILTSYQMYKDELGDTGTTRNKLGIGMLMFPWKKTEFRVELINDRTVADQNTAPDTWTAQGQVHVSW